MSLAWEEIPCQGDVYSPRTGFAVVNLNGTLFLFGGTDGTARQSDVYAFDTSTFHWRKVQTSGSMPAGRSGAQAVVCDDDLWLFGGYTRKDGEYFNDAYKLHTPSGHWTCINAIGEPPAKRTDHSLVRYGRSMYVFGGFDGRVRYNDLVELNLDDARWTTVSVRGQEPRTRFAHASVTHSNSMYIFGGWDGHDTLKEVYEYNFPSKTWSPVHPRGTQPSPRYRHSAVIGGDHLLTFGGVDKAQVRFQDLFALDLVSRVWSEVYTLGTPSARTFHKTVVQDGYLYILGGFDGRRQNDAHRVKISERTTTESVRRMTVNGIDRAPQGLNSTAEGETTFVPEDMWRWQSIPSEGDVYSPRTGHAVVVWGNYFFVFGGTDEQARQNDIYMYETSSMRWSIFK
jgi:N-acetylneuraminic acid mutarotase